MTDYQKMGDDVVRSLSKAASDNPLSAALIGAGVLWMVSGATRPVLAPLSRMTAAAGSAAKAPLGAVKEAMADGLAAAGETAKSAAGAAQNAAQDGHSSIANVLSSAQQQTSDYAGEMYEAAGEMTGSLKQSLSQLFEQQPLALAAVGLAIGAGIAASIPATDFEKEVMGEASAEVTSTFTTIVNERAANIKTAVLDEAGKQGLMPDKAKEAVQTGIEKVKSAIAPGNPNPLGGNKIPRV